MLVVRPGSPAGSRPIAGPDSPAGAIRPRLTAAREPEAARPARNLVLAAPHGEAPSVTPSAPRRIVSSTEAMRAIGRDRPILDSDVVRVAVGPNDEVALLKDRGGSYVIESETGRQLVHSWDDPILDVTWMPNGKVAYLVEDRFFNRLEVRDQGGQRLWDDFGSSSFTDPSAISMGADGKLYFLRSGDSITDDRGMPVYRGWSDEVIFAFAVDSRRDVYVATRDSIAGRDRVVLKDARGRRLHEFERGEQVEAISVRGRTLTYVGKRRTDVFRWVRTVTLR